MVAATKKKLVNVVTFKDFFTMSPSLFFKALKYQKAANEGYAEILKMREQKEQAKEKEDEPPNYMPPTDIVFNSGSGKWERTEPHSDFYKDFGIEEEIEPDFGEDSPFIASTPDLGDDTIENIISKVTQLSGNIMETDPDIARCIILTILFSVDKINSSQLLDHLNPKQRDSITAINTVYKYFNDTKLFDYENCWEMNEFVSMKELMVIVNQLNVVVDWRGVRRWKDITDKIIRGYSSNSKAENEMNGVPEAAPETPIIFNNAVLAGEFDYPDPKLNKKVRNTIIKKITKLIPGNYRILSVDAVADMNSKESMANDTAIAGVTIQDPMGTSKSFMIDIDSIIGNGYNIIVMMPTNTGTILPVFVNLDIEPMIATKVLTTEYQFMVDNQSTIEFNKVLRDMLPYPEIYGYIDFSKMHNNLAKLSEADKVKLANILYNFIRLNWYGLGFPQMPRFRFRKFESVNDFILVSDREVRVQISSEMSWPVSTHAKQYTEYIEHDSDKKEFVIEYLNGNVKFIFNKEEIKFL